MACPPDSILKAFLLNKRISFATQFRDQPHGGTAAYRHSDFIA
jgi:hypothetical protein